MDTITFNIIKHLGVVSKRVDPNGEERIKEVNLVSWNHKEPVIDIREWDEDHNIAGRGLMLNSAEAEKLERILFFDRMHRTHDREE